MKVWKHFQVLALVLTIISISLTGCATKRVAMKNQDMMDIYLKTRKMASEDVAAKIRKDLTLKKAYGYVKPYVPILDPPEVRMIWIPAHMAEGSDHAMVAGHWVYLKIRESEFYIQGQRPDTVQRSIVPNAERIEPELDEREEAEESNRP